MFDVNDSKILWVSPDEQIGDGSSEKPYNSIETAIKSAQPGFTIVLKEGIYEEDVTIEISGTVEMPILITGDVNATVEIRNSCWFFYDTSDLIITNLSFVKSQYGALSLIGTCLRNRFHNLKFIDCGTSKKTSCTIFFGGSGGRFNLVENCLFQHKDDKNLQLTTDTMSIGLMISEGDDDDGVPIKNFIIRRNRFVNYGYGILVGSKDTTLNEYGHLIEYNDIENCTVEGILIKCGDSQIRGNHVHDCPKNSITVRAGIGSIVEDNRVVDCKNGIQAFGSGHTIMNNCIVRCTDQAIRVCGRTTETQSAATNLIVERNTFVDCGISSGGTSQVRVAGIRIDPGTTCIAQRNLIHGEGKPYEITTNSDFTSNTELAEATPKAEFVITDNIGSGNCEITKGVIATPVLFTDAITGNYENESGYGAQGWMLKPEAFDPHVDEAEKDYIQASVLEDENGNLIFPEDFDKGQIFDSYFSENEVEEFADENDEE